MRTELEGVTPELADVIATHIEKRLVTLFTSIPAKVVTYYPDKQYADVQIQLKKKYENGDLKAYPVIPNVPVKQIRANGGKIKIHVPLTQGDDVQLVFSMRSLDNWKTQGGMQDPADRRKFHITDAVAYIGGSAEPDAFDVNDPESVEIQNDQGAIQIKPDGTINVGSYNPEKSAAMGEPTQQRLTTIESGLQTLITSLNTYIGQMAAHTHLVTAPTLPSGPPVPTGSPVGTFTPDSSEVSSSKVKVKS